MPWHVPVILAAGLTVGLGCAIYANREDLRELPEFIREKYQEWEIRRRQRRSQRQRQSQPVGASPNTDGSDRNFALNEFSSSASGYDSFDEMPPNTPFYSTGETTSAAAASLQEHIRHRGVGVQHQSSQHTLRSGHRQNPFADYDSASEVGGNPETLELQGFQSAAESLTDDNESLTAGSLTPQHSSSGGGGWVHPDLSSDDSYSEISTPSISDVNDADYQSLMYASEDDDGSAYRLRRNGPRLC